MICIKFSTGPHRERLQKGGGPGGGGGESNVVKLNEVTQDTNIFSHAEGVGVAKSFHEKFTVFGGGGGQFFFLAQVDWALKTQHYILYQFRRSIFLK